MFKTNAELFGVCIVSLFSVSKTAKHRGKGISYKLFQSCVQILFEAFFDPINIPLRQKWACLYAKWQSFSTYLTKNEFDQHFFVNRSSIKFHDNELSDPWAVIRVETKGESVNRRSSRIRKRLQTPTDLLKSRRDWVSENAFPLWHTHVLTGTDHLLKPVAYCMYHQV